MAEPLSGVAIILVIAFGILAFVMLFIFAKRQIMRFTLRSRRGPHVPVGHDVPKAMRQEIERWLDRISDIKHEPRLVTSMNENFDAVENDDTSRYLYRMKAVDSVSLLDGELRDYDLSIYRKPGQNIRSFLLSLHDGPLNKLSMDVIHAFADSYEHARHDTAEFGPVEYKRHMDLLTEIVMCIKSVKHKNKRRSMSTGSQTDDNGSCTKEIITPKPSATYSSIYIASSSATQRSSSLRLKGSQSDNRIAYETSVA